MAARYALDTFTIQLPSGTSLLVVEGSLRDSTHAACTTAPSKFGTTPPVNGGGHVNALLYARLQTYPAGSEVS